ncbi:molecular chaperone OsmY [Oceanisphaera marina]|uniref:Molecular chaperone OsmY n=1 Tax=Oceanisphaera marina TaxID=2017550 RepID=A0ABQ1IM74_9GAMM|nr:molecular chaperone OsmY [Oceanisphaera marina]
MLSSALASGAALAEDTLSDKASMMSTKAENAAERTGDKLDHAADKAGNAVENTANKAGSAVESTVDKADNLAERTADKTGDFMGDSIITTKVKAQLLDNEAIESGDISVETKSGVVTLSGFVASQEQIKGAIELAGKVEGVTSVSDKLIVKGEEEQSLPEYADDAITTSAVKAKLLTDGVVPSLGVSVETHNGVVQLTGEVETREQASQAEQIAKSVDGVQSVKNDLKIKQS